MDRRDLLKATLGGAAGASMLSAGLPGCAGTQLVREGATPIDELLEGGARVLWVAAHPDDESLAGPILAKAGPRLGNPVHFFILTHGDGGECCLPEGCHPDLASVRGEEMKEVAKLYGATLEHDRYWNAPLPVESFPKRHEIAKRWVEENGDPTPKIAKTIRSFTPRIVLTFAPVRGFTGHPEHQLASRFAMAAVRMAASAEADLPPPAHRVAASYFCLNRYWIGRLLGSADPLPFTETFDACQPCAGDRTCIEVASEFTRPHRTQENDMGTVRKLYHFLRYSYLHRTDPFTEIYDPFEEAARGGMG